MTPAEIALTCLVNTAATYEVDVLHQEQAEALVEVRSRLADADCIHYRLQLIAINTEVAARESETTHLPRFCPDRHINPDGSFCLYWGEHEAIHVIDPASASRWWENLHVFLRQQARAAKAKQWRSDSWAHGDAARHQLVAQHAATTLGRPILDALQQQRLVVREVKTRNPKNGQTLRLELDDNSIGWCRENGRSTTGQYQGKRFRHHAEAKRIRNRRPCEHTNATWAKLTLALQRWKKAEDDYWKKVSKHECCGTLDICPLRTRTTPKETMHV